MTDCNTKKRKDETHVYHGACACGKHQYTIEDDTMTTAAICHCTTCQAWSGGVYVYVETKNVTFNDSDEPFQIWNSSDYCERAFCKTCGSTVYCKIISPGPMCNTYHISAGTLKDWKDIELTKELFVDRKPKGYCFSNKTKTMTADDMFKLFASFDE